MLMREVHMRVYEYHVLVPNESCLLMGNRSASRNQGAV